MFLSHADQDHFNGLPDLLDRFAVEKVCFPAGFGGAANPTAVALIEQVKVRGVATLPLAAPASWSDDGGVRYTVLHPTAGWEPEASDNARSLVLDVTYHGRRLLLTGDLEQHGLAELVAKPPPMIPLDVVLSPHHGGKSANPEWLYEWGWPRLVVVSQRHVPVRTNDPLAWLEHAGVPVLRTWESARSTCNGRTLESARRLLRTMTTISTKDANRSIDGCQPQPWKRHGTARAACGFWSASPVSRSVALSASSWR